MATAGKGTDWQDLANRTALTGNYQVSVSGSTKKANFYAGLGYLHQEGVIEYTDYKRLNAKINASYQLYKNLKIGVNMLFTHRQQRRSGKQCFLPDRKAVAGRSRI